MISNSRITMQEIDYLKDDFFNTALPGGIVCCNVNNGFKVLFVNDFLVHLLGYPNKDDFLSTIDHSFVNCFGDGEDILGMASIVQTMQNHAHHTFTYRLKTKAGNELWFRGYTYKYDDSVSSNVLCFCMDISDIIQLESDLQEQTNRLKLVNTEIQTIISNIPGGVHRCQMFDRIQLNYVSPSFEEMCGYTQAELHALFHNNYSLLLVEEDRLSFSNKMYQLAAEPSDQNLTYRMRRKDGTVIHIADHFRSVRTEDGNMWGFGIATDVTSQYETLAQLQLLTDNIPGGLMVYEYSPRGLDTLYFSDGVCAMLGYSREEYADLVKNNIAGVTFEEDLAMLRPKLKQLLDGDQNIDCIYRQRTRNDSYRWINLRGSVADRWGDVIRVNTLLLDITDIKQSEDKLRIRDEEYNLAINQSGKVVYRYTVADRSVHMLHKAVDLFDFPSSADHVPESIIAMDLFAPESVNDLISFYEAIQRGEPSGCATLHRKRKNANFGWCLSNFTTLFNSSGEAVSAVISIEDITKQHDQELENAVLRQNEELFQIVVSHSDRFIAKYDIATRTAYVQPRANDTRFSGKVFHNVPHGCVDDGIAAESASVYIDFFEQLINGEPTAKAIIKMKNDAPSSQWGWYRFDGSVIFDDKKEPLYAVVSFIEITEQYEKELAYKRIKQHVSRLSKDAMLYVDANLTEMKIEHADGHWLHQIEHILDQKPAALLEAMINKMAYPEDRTDIRLFFDRNKLLADFAKGNTAQEAEFRILQNNRPQWVSVTIEMIADPYTENILIYILFRDIDKTKTTEIRILKQAEMDGLTDLYNRNTLERKIKQMLEARQGEVCAFAILDIDDLKIINDTLGHLQGDRAIKAFADTLRNCFGKQALLGRIGGDEFLVFLQDFGTENDLKETMRSLIDTWSTLRIGENDDYHLHGSIGIVISNSDEDRFDILYKRADIALYYVKRHKKGTFSFYTSSMENITVRP